jgi:glucose-1-phosphate cytidylyltransferase
MKAVILAGGLGTRMMEETAARPKPMVEVGGRPLLWHVMKGYAAHGIEDFVVCLGHHGHVIRDYFLPSAERHADVTVDLGRGTTEFHRLPDERWRVTLIDTGLHTQTGGRIERILPFVDRDEPFCLTYGDGLADVDVTASVAFHRSHGRLVTVTAVQPPGRFGALQHDGDLVLDFAEKPAGDGGWVNGGFFVVDPRVVRYLDGDATVWEREPLERLARDRQLSVFLHRGFWHPMDTLRDREYLQELWSAGRAPWRVW